jgi:hypothetical protein
MSIADAVKDLQEIKTALMRNFLDNLYLSVNGRHAVDVSRVNLEDLLTSRPGGIVRVQGDPSSAVFPLTHQSNYAPVMEGLQYIDDAAESRTGVTKYTQGLDANNLNKTASGIQQISNMAQERVMLICRVVAESGIRELFWIVHSLIRKNEKKEQMMRLRDQWVAVDPRNWVKRYDLTISVGLGTGNKDQQLAHLGNLYQMQMAALQAGLPIVTPTNIYETMKQMAQNAGFKQPEQFVTDPSQIPPAPPQENPLVTVEKIKQDGKAKEVQFNAQVEQQKAQANMQQEQMRSQNDITIEREKIAAQMELERYKAQLDAETKITIAQMNAQIQSQSNQQQAQERMMSGFNG